MAQFDRQQSGIVGSSVQYNSFGLAEEMTTYDLADDDTNIPSGTKIRNTYDIFNDKIIRVTEYDGISVVRNNDRGCCKR